MLWPTTLKGSEQTSPGQRPGTKANRMTQALQGRNNRDLYDVRPSFR
jgi:hypothetical protein